ncbi:polysaccharide biosynthesis protein [Barrientosiimonas marina]|uniref:Oligosaccharide flippase family protein n=2 Tax=Lentibacillus kimchii TaxID=1542911 RepID=A0ABW2US19_9BACI
MEKDKPTQQTLLKGAVWLTLAGMAGKLLSAGYRIPLQNLTGDTGFYVYQQIYPFLSIAMMLALYGFPSAVSKIVVVITSRGQSLSWRSFYIPVFVLLSVIAGSIWIIMYLSAPKIAMMTGDPELVQTYRLASWIFLLIPLPALLRGTFQGIGLMQATAISQISEQLLRLSVIITAAAGVYLWQQPVYTIGPGAVAASCAGLLAAVMILLGFLIHYHPVTDEWFSVPWRYYVTTLVVLGTTAALNQMVLVIIQLADTFTLVPGLKAYGLSVDDARQAKGVFDRGQPLIQLGTVLGSSFALALLPALSGDKLKQEPDMMHQLIRSASLISFYLAIGATAGLIIIFPETNRLLFQNTNGTDALRLLALAVFLSSIGITAASILQGLGYMKRTAAFVAIAFCLKWTANYALVPFFGITGSALATVLSLTMFAGLMIVSLRRKLPELKVLQQVNWLALLLALAGMIGFILGVHYLTGPIVSRAGSAVYVITMALAGAAIYSGLLLRLGAFREQDLSRLPLGWLFIRLHKERNS